MTVTRETWNKMIKDAYDDYFVHVIREKKETAFAFDALGSNVHTSSQGFLRILDAKRGRVTILNIGTGKMGVAKCNKKHDKFDPKAGTAIAWMRYCGQEIPTIKLTVEEVDFGEVIRLPDSSERWLILCKHPIHDGYVLQKLEKVGNPHYIIEVDGSREIEQIL